MYHYIAACVRVRFRLNRFIFYERGRMSAYALSPPRTTVALTHVYRGHPDTNSQQFFLPGSWPSPETKNNTLTLPEQRQLARTVLWKKPYEVER